MAILVQKSLFTQKGQQAAYKPPRMPWTDGDVPCGWENGVPMSNVAGR